MTCKIQEIKKDFYLPEKDGIFQYNLDQTVIIKEQYLKFLSHCNKHSAKLGLEDLHYADDWYPFVNSYYPYTEDVDAFARVNHLLGSKPSFASISSVDCQSDGNTVYDKILYSDNSAQLQYLESNPFCFIILGKPDIGQQELGKRLAEYWKCVYIDPEILIEQEIFSRTRAGQCIQFNLKCGRAIGIDVILRLVEKRIKSETAKHRGFLICGLPLIPNDLYQEDPISSESAVFTVKEIFDDMFDTMINLADVPPSKPQVSVSSKYKSDEVLGEESVKTEEADEEEEEGEDEEEIVPQRHLPVKPPPTEIPLDTGPDYDVCQTPEIGTNYEDQLEFVFSLLKPPFMIIYIMCSSADVMKKRESYRFDVHSKRAFNLQTQMYNNLMFNYFTVHSDDIDDNIPEAFLEEDYINTDLNKFNYLVKLPRHFPANISTQLDAYHYTGLNFIERRVLMHDPQYFLKVDGRTSVQRMLHIIKSRLSVLPIQQVILPSRLVSEPLEMGEEESPNMNKDESLKVEDWYRELSRKNVASSTFKWNWSDWGAKCPVSLKEGLLKTGDPTYAVHFMNKIFFLANEENFFKFHANPRPYILPPEPKSTCKIFVFGPKHSGKTAVSRTLGYLLNGTVVSTTQMLAEYLMSQEEELKEKIRQAAIVEALKLLNEQRVDEAKLAEAQRIEKIKEWIVSTKKTIEEFIGLLIAKDQTTTSFEISSFPMAMKKVSVIETENPIAMEYIKLKDYITNTLHIPLLSKPEEWQALILDKRKLLSYLPVNLRSKVVPKPATVFDTFVIDFAKNAVEIADLHATSLTEKSLADIIITHIKTIEENQVQQGNNKGGWILDGMFCDLSVLDEMYPNFIADEVVVLLDDKDPDFLLNRNEGDNHFTEYRDFFMGIGKLDAAWRSPAKIITKTESKVKIVEEILSEIINDPTFNYGEESAEHKIAAYKQDILNFYEKWEQTNKYFVEHDIEPIVINITNKSIQDLMKDVIKKIEDRYREPAFIFTELDRAEEVRNFGNEMLQKTFSEGADNVNDETLETNRRYGDTYHYCPVTYHDNWVLWRGKEDFAVKFENKLYLLSNADNMKQFLDSPRNYLSREPPQVIPPPRICVIGVPGIGKTTIAKALATNYGLVYVNFEALLKKSFGVTNHLSLNDLRRSNTTDLTLHSYLNEDSDLSEDILNDITSKLWFEKPTRNLGFVFDDFPKRPSDIKFMVNNKLIPDIIIKLTNKDNLIKDKLIHDYVNRWETEIKEKQIQTEAANNAMRREWDEKRKKRFEELIEERRERRYSLKKKGKENASEESPKSRRYMEDLKEVDEKTDKSSFRTDSQVSFDSVAEQDDINEVNKMLDVEFPELVFESPLDAINDAKQRFDAVAIDTITVELQFLNNIKALCVLELIPLTEITTSFDFPNLTERRVFSVCDEFKFRTKSFLERCYDVSMEIADRLLSSGYYFLSKFGKTCPVQYQEDKNPIQMYIPMELKGELYPVIHRNYIYYIGGRENQIKFKRDPLKYISIESFHFPIIPFKTAVTGPPKCGKTVLASRIAREFGCKLVTRGQAARYVLSFLPFSDLARNMETVLRNGWELTDEMVIKCVEAASFDSKAVTQARRVPVPDERFDYLCEYFKPVSKVPAFLNVVDIAGLVKGASEGQGLGNAFLSHISACDAIFHLCRVFEDDDVTHVEGEVNPVRDLDIICEELRLKDEDTLNKNLEKLERTVLRGGDKKQKPEFDALMKVKQILVDEKKHIRFADWDGKDIEVLNKYLFLTSKPAIYLVNLSEKDYIKKKNKWLIKIKEWVDKNDPGAIIIPFSGAFEHKLLEEYEDPVLRKKFLEDNNATSALDKIIVQGYKALQLEYFFTAGPDEVKAWTIQKGTKAPQAAGRIHTDFEKGFIMAEVMKFVDFKEEGTEAACKAAGKYRQQGRNYVVEDGDIIFFKFNAGAGLQAKKK